MEQQSTNALTRMTGGNVKALARHIDLLEMATVVGDGGMTLAHSQIIKTHAEIIMQKAARIVEEMSSDVPQDVPEEEKD